MTKAKTVTELEAELKIARESTEAEKLRTQLQQSQVIITSLEQRLRRADFQVNYTGKLMKAVKDAISDKHFREELDRFEAQHPEG